MKFSLKSIVAAVAMTVASASAVADVQPGNLVSGAAGGELLFYAFNDANKSSYIRDLGVTFQSFVASPTYAPVNIAADANWQTYLATVGGNLSTTYWGVYGSVRTNGLTAGGVQTITTARNNTTATTLSSLIRGMSGAMDNIYLADLQGASTNYAANDSYVFDSGVTSQKNWQTSVGHNLYGKVSFNADNLVGIPAAGFYRLSGAASATTAATITTLIAPQAGVSGWSFDGTTLQTLPVPEPETYGMLLAGLALVGAIVRRRKAA